MARPPAKHFMLWYLGTVMMNVIPAALILWFVFRGFVRYQFSLGWQRFLISFLIWEVALCFIEWFFHRYVLHKPAFPLLRWMYDSHTHHHALTPIKLEVVPGNTDRRILNRYPIVDDEQHDDAAFPEWVIAAFWGVFAVPLALGQLIFPRYPIILSGMIAVVCSLMLYEIFHSMAHRPYEWWKSATEMPKVGWIMRNIYAFHHFHHANILANEAISGFFGLPLADWCFGTYQLPKKLLLDNQMATIDAIKIRQPPLGITRWLDRWATERSSRLHHRSSDRTPREK